MAIDHGMWRIGAAPTKLQPVKLENENLLEELITKDISILNDGWLLVGRQVRTGFDKFIDLLAVDADGSLIVIELKRHRTPRDVVAQAIDYASWIQGLTDSKVIEIYEAEPSMFRKDLIELLLNNPTGVAEIARLLDMSPRDVEDDLHHLQKSLKYSDYKLVVHPAHCRKCGFKFHDDKLHKPGKCPQCHETWIEEPKIEVVGRG